ncbi:MAG: type IV pilus assembly protein PilM [Limnothrix sp. CACIAM 69d]|uniref:type IV pilus assembly protein PilM n=1 Tax=unclassified Limnothrix TaxID=2632864 RepID=UPI000B0525D4|nr:MULTISPECIES: type IV pilus assembly protein PilM [unclassified Limnothrix]RFP60028.1 MAG: type IV pilus assembly protein PilM [Limnothrix sp. CACIAM 69d]MBD2160889.1 type IV pilus assembly protein PilM [Limnothrix sp. FACHB-1083]MBD2191590.1 type IV pilus assembly protein PilM [Limnothrix sp. FACHB-1088]MBD2553816.1 type IV pilus assembly protein PilM [Limnothrix sp. FACHB-708]MBD2590838.1 type IV pilus assembly protein PilM [Limnothrix sp. FACHB-406]
MNAAGNLFAPLTNAIGSLLGGGKKGIGIEISPERINLVQLQKKGQKFKLNILSSVEVPEGVIEEGAIVDPPAAAELIQAVIQDSRVKVKEVATAIPGRETVIRLIPVPAELNDDELRQYMNQEAGLYLPFPREEADVDYQKLGYFTDEDGIEKVQVLLVATRREVTDAYLDTFEQAGLRIKTLEISSFALIRTIREQLRGYASNQAVVLVDIQFDSSEIAIVVDGVPQFSRTVPIGTLQMQEALNRAMNTPPSRSTDMLMEMTIPISQIEAVGAASGTTGMSPGSVAIVKMMGELADELRRSVDFYLNQSENLEIAQLMLAGPGAAIGEIDEFFTQRLNVPVMRVDPIESLGLEADSDITEAQRASLGVVLGLGLRNALDDRE